VNHPLGEFIIYLGKLGSALGILAGIVVAIGIKPYRKQKARKEAEEARFEKLVLGLSDSIKAIEEIREDVSEIRQIVKENGRVVQQQGVELLAIERISLKRTKDYLVKKGYATDAERDDFFQAYQQYEAKGGNHLTSGFLQEIKDLPKSQPRTRKCPTTPKTENATA
jgi:hypothetical protein